MCIALFANEAGDISLLNSCQAILLRIEKQSRLSWLVLQVPSDGPEGHETWNVVVLSDVHCVYGHLPWLGL